MFVLVLLRFNLGFDFGHFWPLEGASRHNARVLGLKIFLLFGECRMYANGGKCYVV